MPWARGADEVSVVRLRETGSRTLIVVAIAAVGRETRFHALRKTGVRPLPMGLAASVVLAAAILVAIKAVGMYVRRRARGGAREVEMRKLILVKHARPAVVESVPSHEWGLSAEGRSACGPLAEAIRPHAPAVVVTSDEPKACETGRLIADALGVPVETAVDLHEHDRTNVPMMRSGEFLSALALFFKQPDRLVLGRETADQALGRFERSIGSVLSRHAGGGNVAVVTHGTVLALFVAAHGGGDPFQLYRRLGLPSFAVFSADDLRLIDQQDRVPPG